MKAPSLADTLVKVRAYLTDEVFGYEHWRAGQFATPATSRPAILVIYDSEAERDAALTLLRKAR